jgi:hypothetical protein
MQIAVFEMVKRGLSIDAALAKARTLEAETSFDQDSSSGLRPEVCCTLLGFLFSSIVSFIFMCTEMDPLCVKCLMCAISVF